MWVESPTTAAVQRCSQLPRVTNNNSREYGQDIVWQSGSLVDCERPATGSRRHEASGLTPSPSHAPRRSRAVRRGGRGDKAIVLLAVADRQENYQHWS